MAKQMKVLGRTVKGKTFLDERQLEILEAPKNLKDVTYHVEEFTSLCPITGQPDYASLKITLIDTKKIIESKSLKLYLFGYREEGAFAETICSDLATLLSGLCSCACKVEGHFASARTKTR